MDKKLQGVIPPVITPFKDEELDIKAYKANIEKWNSTGLAGYLVAGSNGEAVFLDDKERDEVIAASKEAAAPDKIIMAGTGAESTVHTIKQTKRAAELGADCALAITPAYFTGQMTGERLTSHYLKVADASPIPILLYNFPQATGVNMGPDAVAAMSEHPNIAGIKDSSGNIAQLSEIIHLSSDDFSVFVGNSETLFPALALGADGAILAVSNVIPEFCVEMMQRFDDGEIDKVRDMQWKMAHLAAMVTRIHGVGGLKAVMKMAGYSPGQVRSPLTMPPPEVVDQLGKLLKNF